MPLINGRTVVRDIIHKKPEQINISYRPYTVIPLKFFIKSATIFVVIFSLIGSAQAPITFTLAAESDSGSNDSVAERAALQQQLVELERQIIENQKTVEEYQKQGKTLTNEINTLNTQIKKINLQIQAVTLSLGKLDKDIKQTQGQISNTEVKIDGHKSALSKSLRNLYEADNKSLVEVLLANRQLSAFFGNITNTSLVQENIRTSLVEITKLRQDLLEQKQELAAEKDDVENLKRFQESQKQNIATTQKQKANLLTATKGKESEYQKILQKTKESAAQIRSRIFQLLGGGELSFEKAYEYAKLAEGATGVRAAFILAILNHESLLGKNVGRCNYKTAMHPTRDIPVFLDILRRLGMDPDSSLAQVSCPNRDGAYGGAMGPAQFIPATWKLYEAGISRITNSNPPSPWNNADAFAATALYLKDSINSSGCKDYSKQIPGQEKMLLERCAAAKYYAGSRWYTYRFAYGDKVVTKANQFQQDINVLNG